MSEHGFTRQNVSKLAPAGRTLMSENCEPKILLMKKISNCFLISPADFGSFSGPMKAQITRTLKMKTMKIAKMEMRSDDDDDGKKRKMEMEIMTEPRLHTGEKTPCRHESLKKLERTEPLSLPRMSL